MTWHPRGGWWRQFSGMLRQTQQKLTPDRLRRCIVWNWQSRHNSSYILYWPLISCRPVAYTLCKPLVWCKTGVCGFWFSDSTRNYSHNILCSWCLPPRIFLILTHFCLLVSSQTLQNIRVWLLEDMWIIDLYFPLLFICRLSIYGGILGMTNWGATKKGGFVKNCSTIAFQFTWY
jgi:hypothetical protein